MAKHDILIFLTGVILPCWEILSALGRFFGKGIKAFLLRSYYDNVAYSHYKLRRMKQGHAAKNPVDCYDGQCAEIH